MPLKSDIEPVSKQLTIVIGLTVVGFMAFGLALSFYRNILFEKTLQDMQAENDKIAEKIQQGYADLEYYQSDQYKDKYAKANLNKLNKGEKMMIISNPPPDPALAADETTALDTERQQAAYYELLDQMPVIEHWNLFFFNREKIDELKKAVLTQ
jgi:cell division protein FtsB